MRLHDLTGKRIVIWGLGNEGRAVVEILPASIDAEWLLFCDSPLSESEQAFLAQHPEISFDPEASIETLLQNADVLIKSPGISLYRAEIVAAIKNGVRVTSGTNIWFAERSDEKTIVVTGTKGKSTSSAALRHALAAAGHSTELVGNIGVPVLKHLHTRGVAYWVIELSSYQIADFVGTPTYGILLNIFSEHLDWHMTQENYTRDKSRLCNQIDSKGCLVTTESLASRIASTCNATVVPYDGSGAYFQIEDHALKYGGDLLPVSKQVFPGNHMLRNLQAVFTLLARMQMPISECMQSLDSFEPLPHRLTPIGTHSGVHFIDDSISTIPESSVAAIQSLAPMPCILILGGFDRNLSWFESARDLLAENVKAIVCTGTNGERIYSTLHRTLIADNLTQREVVLETEFKKAVLKAISLAGSGDAVLLSPGSPSYDCFSDFKARGRAFRTLCPIET